MRSRKISRFQLSADELLERVYLMPALASRSFAWSIQLGEDAPYPVIPSPRGQPPAAERRWRTLPWYSHAASKFDP
jgi:hypothetical protein